MLRDITPTPVRNALICKVSLLGEQRWKSGSCLMTYVNLDVTILGKQFYLPVRKELFKVVMYIFYF